MFKLATILTDLETIFNKTTDTEGDILWPGKVDISAPEKPSLINGPKLLMGLVPSKHLEGMGGREQGEFKIVLLGLIPGRSHESALKSYNYFDIMLDEVKAIRDGYRTDWTIQGVNIAIEESNPGQILDIALKNGSESPTHCSGFAMTFMVTKNNE